MSTNTTTLVETGNHTSLPASFCKQVGNGSSFKLSNELPTIPMQPIKANIRVKRNKVVDGKGPWAGIYITFPESKDSANADMPYSTVITANVKAIRDGLLIPSPNDPDRMIIGFETAGWDAENQRIVLQ